VKARILPIDSDAHRRAQELLPWWVNGTLDDFETAQTRDHLARCTVCQEDAAALEAMRDIPVASSPREDVDLGWAALKRRLDAPKDAPRVGALLRPGWRDALKAMVAIQAAVIVGLALALWWQRPPLEPYRALGAAPESKANAIAVFRSDATQAQTSAALRVARARIVGGPTATDAYLLLLPDADPAALARLRAQPGVLEVQSLEAPSSR